jgi:hypothetical protein
VPPITTREQQPLTRTSRFSVELRGHARADDERVDDIAHVGEEGQPKSKQEGSELEEEEKYRETGEGLRRMEWVVSEKEFLLAGDHRSFTRKR